MTDAAMGSVQFETARMPRGQSGHDSLQQRNRIYKHLKRRNWLVGFLRIIVPTLGICLTLFLVAQIIIANIVAEYGIEGITIEDDKIVILSPEYSGVMDDGTLYTVVAEGAQIDANQTDLVDLDLATLKTLDPREYEMTAFADFAKLDLAKQTVTVPDLMRTVDSDGVEGALHDVFINWQRQRLTANSDVQMDFPDGARIVSEKLLYNGNADVWRFTTATYTIPSTAKAPPETVIGETMMAADATNDVVTADELVVREKRNTAAFDGNVVITRPDLTIWSDRLLVQFTGGRLEEVEQFDLEGNVRIRDSSQTTSGDRGIYDPETSMMVLTGDVTVVNDSGVIKAPTLTSNLDTHVSTFTSSNGERVVGDFKSEDDVKIASDRFVIREDDNVAEFLGNVIVDQAKTRVFADRVVVYLSEGGSQNIRYYEAFENVTVLEPEQTTTGNRARYDPTTKKMNMTGNVQVTNESGTVEANGLTVDLDSNVSTFTSNENGRVSGVFTPDGGSVTPPVESAPIDL